MYSAAPQYLPSDLPDSTQSEAPWTTELWRKVSAKIGSMTTSLRLTDECDAVQPK